MVASAGTISAEITADSAKYEQTLERVQRARKRFEDEQGRRDLAMLNEQYRRQEQASKQAAQLETRMRKESEAARSRAQADALRSAQRTWQVARAAATGAAIAIGIATRAVHDYAQSNDETASQLRKLGFTTSEIWRELGQDISAGAEELDRWAKLAQTALRWAREVRDFELRRAGVDVDAINEANDAEAAESGFRRQQRAFDVDDSMLKRELDVARASEDTDRVRELERQLALRGARREIAAKDAELRRTNNVGLRPEDAQRFEDLTLQALEARFAKEDATAAERAQADAAQTEAQAQTERETAAREQYRLDQELFAARAQVAAADARLSGDEVGARRIEETERNRRAVSEAMDSPDRVWLLQEEARLHAINLGLIEQQADAIEHTNSREAERIGYSLESMAIDQMRRRGKEQEAEMARIALDFEQRRLDVERSSLGDKDKAEALARLSDLEAAEYAIAASTRETPNTTTTRTIAAGLGSSAGVRAQIFGPGIARSRRRSPSMEDGVTITRGGPGQDTTETAAGGEGGGDPLLAQVKQAVAVLTSLERKLPGPALAG